MNGKNKYSRGMTAEMSVMNELFGNNKSVLYHYPSKDKNGKEIGQIVIVNNKTFRCPDLEVYEKYSSIRKDIAMRVEVKSFNSFPKESELPFKTKSDILIISKAQFEDYFGLQKEEEIPITIVFAIGDNRGLNYKYYWSYLEEMIRFPKREGFYTWKWSGDTELCYFFKSESFNNNIREL